jgi:hypothetical protein
MYQLGHANLLVASITMVGMDINRVSPATEAPFPVS